MISYAILKTSVVGDLLLAANPTHLVGVHFAHCSALPALRPEWKQYPQQTLLRQAAAQLQDYFAGKRRTFSLPIMADGTPFQREIWKRIAQVPFGETITYSELAHRAGAPRAVRAAGTATGRNPLGIIIPCHRVVGMHGALGGYAGGLENKRALLAAEKITIQ